MRILGVSLLRLGDVLMASPALRSIKEQYPNAKLDLLVNESSQILAPLLSDVDSVYTVERRDLQEALVCAERPLFEAFDKLNKTIQKLNSNEYDLVINLTQNRFSGHICALIQAKEHLGLMFNNGGLPRFGSPWFKYLNDVVAAGAETIFHYSDIFSYGIASKKKTYAFNLRETDKGRNELEQFLTKTGYKSGPHIVVQFVTSDTKKNWGLKNWAEAISQFLVFEPQAQIALLVAPNEVSQAHKFMQMLPSMANRIHIAEMSIEGAYSLLCMSDLLLTGDTSIKHLASATQIPILEIALGSSDVRKTGTYRDGALIVSSREECAPCEHSSSCPKASHLCGESVEPSYLALLASKFLHKDWSAVRVLAEEYSDKVNIFKTQFSAQGFWSAEMILDIGTDRQLSAHLDRAAWYFLLEKEHLKPLAEYGSESRRIKNDLQGQNVNISSAVLKMTLSHLENMTIKREDKINRILGELARKAKFVHEATDVDFVDQEFKMELNSLESELGLGSFLTEKVNLNLSTGIFRLRQLQLSLGEIFNQQQIKLKLLRSLITQMTEST